jgi:hypothetical protein
MGRCLAEKPQSFNPTKVRVSGAAARPDDVPNPEGASKNPSISAIYLFSSRRTAAGKGSVTCFAVCH